VKKFKSDTYKHAKDKDKPQHNDCIQNYLRAENYAIYQMKIVVLETSSLTTDERFNQIEVLRKAINRMFKISSKACILADEYGEIFEIFFNLNGMNEEDKILFSCIQKYSIEHDLISSHNSTTTSSSFLNLNCTGVVNEFISDMEESLVENLKQEKPDVTQQEIDCSLKIYRDHNYTQKLIAAVVLGKRNLNETQKLREKSNFIKFMALITHSVQSCF
jgi:hypothetical protein